MKRKNSRAEISSQLAARAAQVQRGAARAAVLGVNDGLVSTLCLVVGVAASGAGSTAVLIAGFAGLVAGAISMAAGEWISVKTQVELFEGVLRDIKKELRKNRPALMDNLAHTLVGYGVSHSDAHKAVKDVASNEHDLVNLYATQVIGINPDELGSPWLAAVSSFALFAGGSLVPLLAWLLGLSGEMAIMGAIIFTSAAGLFVGGYTAQSSGRPVLYGAVRQLVIIVLSSAVTYGIGTVIGGAIT